MNQKKGSRNIILIGIAALIIIILTTGIAMYMSSRNGAGAYQKKLELARQYVAMEEYDDAIRTYAQAIQIDQSRSEAYLELAATYEQIQDYDSANYVLQKGLTNAHSVDIEKALQILEANAGETVSSDKTVEKEPTANTSDAGLKLNTDMLAVFSSGSMADLSHHFGRYDELQMVSDETFLEGTFKKVTFPETGLVCYYPEETLTQTSIPAEIHMNSIQYMFVGMQEELSFEKLTQMGLKSLEVVHPRGRTMLRFVADSYQVYIDCDEAGNITDPHAVNYIVPNRTQGVKQETHKLYGEVTDATKGDGIGGATIVLSLKGDIVAEAETDGQGNYVIENLQQGDYEVHIESEGFADLDGEVYIYDYAEETEQNFVLSPEMAENQIRIILSWDATPRDLDSYLITESNEICFYANPVISAAALDVDDRDGYGPETITLTDTSGTYHYMVHDYEQTTLMGVSGATVTIYKGNELAATIHVNEGVRNLWDVCWIRNGEIEVVNSASSAYNFDNREQRAE